ncbi:L-galactose dehydrogenase-like [Cotesia glomerata]|nr:L-galactose dehydrogenase-like [Cotesia glomerata]
MASLPLTYVEGFHDLEAIKSMKYSPLGKTGLMVSKLGFGGATLCNLFGTCNEDEAIETIRQAIRQGINYIDTAYWYGQGRSETIIGKALKGIPRKAYYIATKIGRYEPDFQNMFDFTAEKTRKFFNIGLERLQLDYVDVIQIHDADYAPSVDIIINETLPELSRQVALGKARHIGITGYTLSFLKECVMKSNVNIGCILNYARHTLIDQTLLEYIPFFKEHNVGVINGATIAMRLLTNADPPEWNPADDQIKKTCREAAEYCRKSGSDLARLAIWFSMQCDGVATNLIGIQNMEQLKANIDIANNGISDKELQLLENLQKNFFSKIKGSHWEGKEIKAYWAALDKLKK